MLHTLSASLFLGLLTTVLALSAGQILFKRAAMGMIGPDLRWQQVLLNTDLLAALVVYAAATALWVALLRKLPLSTAYPFVALAYFFVPLLGHWFLAEPMRWQSFVGAIIIAFGIWVSVGWE